MCLSILVQGDAYSEHSYRCVTFLKLSVAFHFFAEYPFAPSILQQFDAYTSFVINSLFTVIINFPYKLGRLLLLENQVEISEGKILKF